MPQVRVAIEADRRPWLELAREVEPTFGPLVNDPRFRRALDAHIGRGLLVSAGRRHRAR